MSCIFCGFENPETETHCFRCGRDLDTSSIDVMPERLKRGPRPSSWAERRSSALQTWRQQEHSPWVFPLLSLVPGLGQWMAGHPRRALVMLALWLGAFLLRLVFDPPSDAAFPYVNDTFFWHWLVQPEGMIIGVHSAIMVDAYLVESRSRRRRLDMRALAAISLASVVVLYLVHFALPIQPPLYFDIRYMPYTDGTILSGDRIVVEPENFLPVVGQSVIIRGVNDEQRNQVVATVLAGPNDRFSVQDGVVTVNGVPHPVTYLAERPPLNQPEQIVAAGRWLVVAPLYQDRGVLLVSAERILGRVSRIVRPKNRKRILP